MGISLYCGDKYFGTSYSCWGTIRSRIIEITLKYLMDLVEEKATVYELKKNEGFKDEEEEEELTIQHEVSQSYGKMVKGFYDNIINNIPSGYSSLFNDTSIRHAMNFIHVMQRKLYNVDVLVYFGVGGLFSLCYKSDCEGYYSPGNSRDICDLLDVIKSSIEKQDEDLYETVYEGYDNVYDIFAESVKTNSIIIIK